jgi:hypothetical protein
MQYPMRRQMQGRRNCFRDAAPPIVSQGAYTLGGGKT